MLTASIFSFLAATSSKSTTSGSTAGSLIFFVVVIGLLFLMYRMFMRPRQRAAQSQRDTLLTLEPGDEVLTGAGIFGTIQHIEGQRVTLWTGTGSTVTVLRRTIVRKVDESDPEYGTGEDPQSDEHESWDDDDTAALEAHTEHDEEDDEGHDDEDEATHGVVSTNGTAESASAPPTADAKDQGADPEPASDNHLSDRIEELTSPDRAPEDEDR